MEQDPLFAFRIIVDIASKALSPAINDPTTAVLALDQLHRLLWHVGKRRLDEGNVVDAQGRLRFASGRRTGRISSAWRSRRFAIYGAGSLQVARRLRAMLEHLIRVLPEPRHAALKQELDLLRFRRPAAVPRRSGPRRRGHRRLAGHRRLNVLAVNRHRTVRDERRMRQ